MVGGLWVEVWVLMLGVSRGWKSFKGFEGRMLVGDKADVAILEGGVYMCCEG